MSPQTAQSCDGEKAAELFVGWVADGLPVVVLGSFLTIAPIRLCAESLLLLLWLFLLVLLLLLTVTFRQFGELDAELGVLGMVLYNRLNLGLSLLDVDSER